MNILLVVSDTLRRDHLSFYEKCGVIAPNLENFAQQSIVFDRCYPASFSHCSGTLRPYDRTVYFYLSSVGTTSARGNHPAGLYD